jgi:glutamate formiminotransferase
LPVAQVSMNVERPLEVPLRTVVEAVRRHAQVASAELVGLAPRVALEGFPADVAMPAFDPERQVIENVLMGSHSPSAAGRRPASRAPRISG